MTDSETGPPAGGAVTKYTINLDPQHHRTLHLVALDARVPASQVLRTLLEMIEADPRLRSRVISSSARP